jgi:guanosine-3',5'-bis(diphosphate) 3'-pyrophosphohydrolase
MSAMIVRAAQLARALYQAQVRGDDTSYFDGHLMAVADVLFDAGASREMIAAGYLYRAVARGALALGEIERDFGAEVAAMIAGLSDRWHGHARPLQASYTAIELERLAAESAQVQTITLADDLVSLREAHLLEPEAREVLVAEVTVRMEQLLLADAQVRYQVHAELARWTDSGQTLLRALTLMEWSAHSRQH